MAAQKEQLVQSMADLDLNTRPDIKTARDASSTIKQKLGYRDEEELDTGVQKVQPLPYLDEEIQKYHDSIRDSVETSQKVNDTIPAQVLQKVDKATQLATDGETSLFKASQLLEFTFEAYQYARGAAQDQFDLKRNSERYLTKFEEDFKNMISSRMDAELERATAELVNCQRALEDALNESRRDVEIQELRAKDEDAVINTSSLVESHEQVQEMVKAEKSELKTIGDQCLRDMKTIDEELSKLKDKMERGERQYRTDDRQRSTRLEANRKEQRELEERLRVLKAEEAELVGQRTSGEQLQLKAEEAYAGAERDIMNWKKQIEYLRTRTGTSMAVMSCMEECTDMIMEDAKGKKARWKERLKEMAVECRWILRECLVVKGAANMMVLEDNKLNAAESKKCIAHYENEKMTAARRGFAPMVNEAKTNIEKYTAARVEYEEKITESSDTIKSIREEMANCDELLQELRPGLKLDTLEERYKELERVKENAFSGQNPVFSFYHRLPH